MNSQLATIVSRYARDIIIILVFVTITCLRKHLKLAEFWTGMVRQWRTATILALIYLIASGISITAFKPDPPYLIPFAVIESGAYMFCLTMLGLGFAVRISGFEPLHLRHGTKAISSILVGVLILFALSGLIHFPISQGLVALGITGPPEATSGLEFFQEFSLVQIFFMLLMGAGIAEEVFFRLFIMTGLWCLLKRSSLAILISAILFGTYHLSPLDTLYPTFWDYPVYQFIVTFLFGLAAAWIYQKKGLEAAILGHTLGNFMGVVIMKLSL